MEKIIETKNTRSDNRNNIPDRYEFVGTSRSSKLNSLTKDLCESGQTFTTIDAGNGYEVVYNDGVVFKDTEKFATGKFVYITGLVLKEVKQRVENGDYVPFNKDNDRSKLETVLFHPDNIMKNCGGTEAVAIDISKCYFKTAELLGVISSDFAMRVMAKGEGQGKEFNVALSTSIGSLGAINIVRNYIQGKHASTQFLRRDLNVCRLDIIDSVWSWSMEIINNISSGFLMFLTDCFYVMPEYAEIVCKALEKRGYDYKTERVWFDSIGVKYYNDSPVYNVRFLKESNIAKFKAGERSREESIMNFGSRNCFKSIINE